MGESNSRYSIVERLTETKLNVMSQKAGLQEDILNQTQHIKKMEKDFENWKSDSEEDRKRAERKLQISIDNEKQTLANLQERLIEKQKVFDDKLIAIEKALNSIEEISKSSTTIVNK
jgi:carbonic anhydrase